MSIVALIGWLLVGVTVGAIGTLIGAGGGFLLVPLLLLIDSNAPPSVVTAISLAVVSANAWSGSITYGLRRRIAYRFALVFAACSVPGVIAGVSFNLRVSRPAFMAVFAVLLTVLAGYTLRRGITRVADDTRPPFDAKTLVKGGAASVVIAFAASFLGIGGGLLHVPLFVYALGFAPHAATATSHAVLALTATLATVLHLASGDLANEGARVAALAVGVVGGAQIGAALSARVRGVTIMRVLAVALLLVAARIAYSLFA